MIVFLLLVIIAIMLFGASRFIGAIGAILGAIVLLLAVFFGIVGVAKLTGADSGDVLMYVCVGILVLAVWAGIAGLGKKPS